MSNKPKALTAWKNMRENHENLKRYVLELLRHPEATAEHIMQAREAYIKCHESMVHAQNKLIDTYGNYGGVVKFNDWKGE
jgi:hypothetical protein